MNKNVFDKFSFLAFYMSLLVVFLPVLTAAGSFLDYAFAELYFGKIAFGL